MHETLTKFVDDDTKGLSATIVARLKRKWADEYAAWRSHSFTDRTGACRWEAGVYRRMHGATGKLGALVVIGVDQRGHKALLAVEEGVREFTQN